MGTFAVATRNSMLTAIVGGTAYSNPAVWGQLHLGAPGAAGTANPAALTTRAQIVCATPAASRSIANTSLASWPAASTAETYSHWSFWTANAAGSFIGDDDMSSAAPVAVGENLQIAVGGMVFTLPSSASSLSDAVVNALLDAYARNVSYSNAQTWVQLHTGAPGAAGTANVASNSTRIQVTNWGTPSGGSVSITGEVAFNAAPANETYTDVTLWSASTGGTLIAPDALPTPHVAVIGNIFRLTTLTLAIT